MNKSNSYHITSLFMKINIHCLIQLFVILFLSFEPVLAQSDVDAKAPTLQVGLDGLSFAKGSLDAQLIMEIVAEKQKEIKVTTIQNVLLNRVQDAGGTVYSYMDNVVRELVFEPDQQVRTKKIMENTVNLVFTASYLNFYLASLEKESVSRINMIELACIYNKDLKNRKASLISKEILNISDFSIGLQTLKFDSDKKAVAFIALLFDMTSKAIRGDAKLKQLGLMQIAYSETYEYMNLYNQLIFDEDRTQIKKLVKSAEILELDICTYAKAVFEHIGETLLSCTNFIGVVNYLVDEKTFRNDNSIVSNIAILERIKISFQTDKLVEMKDSLKSLIYKMELEQLSQLGRFTTIPGANILVHKQDSTLKADIQNLVKIYFYIDKAIIQINATKSDSKQTKLRTYADILYTLNTDFIPILKNQSYRSFKYLEIIDSLNVFNRSFFINIISDNDVLKKYTSDIPQFLQLVSKLYQFDRGSTISQYMNILDDIGTSFPDDNVKNALSTVITFVKDYSIIESNDNNREVLSFNIESFLYKLQSIKPYSNQRFSLLFTVGVNNAMFSDDLLLPDSSIGRNLSFVGEKIGVKFTMYNWAFSRTRNPGETYKTSIIWPFWNTDTFIKTGPPEVPIISNWHLIAYGSGILYNMVNTKTQSEFNMPIIGIGSGLTFYNGLDFNISWGVPIKPNQPISSSDGLWNIGFDIQFIEYYERLMEKRNNNQIQKRLVEAQIKQ